MRRVWMKSLFVRSGIILFWIVLICCALYWPKVKFLSYDENTLNVFAWGDILDPSVVAEFEKQSGIKVNLNYYASNEELLVKLRATGGEGYDLVVPSDYAVKIMTQEGLLKKLDKEKFTFYNSLNPVLLDHFFDPENTYSIPFAWELFGFGIDLEYFAKYPTEPSWKMVFDPETIHYKITMLNDPIEAVDMAAFYLYGPEERALTPTEIDEVRDLLIAQKKWVTAYADFRGDYFLATRNCAVVVASSSYIWRTKRLFDFVGFVVPKEGSFVTIENLCIPKKSTKEHLVYPFINFLYSPSSIATHYETYGFFPPTLNAFDQMSLDPQAFALIHSTKKEFEKFHYTRDILPQDILRNLWVEVKASEL